MIRLDGYEVLDVLAESATRVLVRARPAGGGEPVVVKLLTADPPAAEDVARLQHECSVTAGLPDDAVVRPLRTETFGHRAGLVMADDGGIPLSGVIPAGGMDTATFLRLAHAFATAVGRVHEAGVVHRDLKPTNAVVEPGTGAVRLLDFGLATRLPRVAVDAEPPTRLEGTLAYMAPEQTGRLNRSVDHRSDLYSAGVTLYQMLYGQLPFAVEEPLELIRCHLAVPPRLPDRAGAPPVVTQIVARLLEKDPERRYQSAHGLVADLATCLRAWEADGEVAPFRVAAEDLPGRLSVPERLYGRDAETAELADAVGRAAEGARALVLLSGPAGIGKTALVDELGPQLASRRFLYVQGKFDQFGRDVPYAPLIEAVRSLIRTLLAGTEAQVGLWRERILAGLGANAGVVAAMVPDLTLLTGPVPPVAEVGPAETQNRFTHVFRQFVGLLARPEHPLAVFLDDLHWADPASLKLLGLLLGDTDLGHLAVIGAYRPAEVSPSHPLAVLLAALDPGVVRRVEVGPLSAPVVAELAGDTVRRPPGPLADYLHDRTGGNPFFLRQVLDSLAADGLLRLEGGTWAWDVEEVRAHGLPGDVVEFLTSRLATLPAETQELLRLAAVIGSRFDLATLAAALDRPVLAVAGPIWPALAAGVILPSGKGHELVAAGADGASVAYRFLHDRVQQAAHGTVPGAELPALHLRVGELKLRQLGSDDGLLEVVGHLNAAGELVSGPDARRELAVLNLRAARKAATSTAFATALQLLDVAEHLLPEDRWEQAYEETFGLHVLRAESLGMLGRVDEAEADFGRVLAASRTTDDFAAACGKHVETLLGAGRVAEAYAAARSGLDRLGFVPMADDLSDERLTAAALVRLLDPATVNGLRDAPLGDTTAVLIAKIMDRATLAAWFAQPAHIPLLVGVGVDHALRDGVTGGCGMLVGCLAMFAMTTGNRSLAMDLAEVAIEATIRAGDGGAQSRALMVGWFFALAWERPFAECDAAFEEAIRLGQQFGDFQLANFSIAGLVECGFAQGRDLGDALARSRRLADDCRRWVPVTSGLAAVTTGCLEQLTGDPDDSFDADAALDWYRAAGDTGMRSQILCFLVGHTALMGDYRSALRYAAEADSAIPQPSSAIGLWLIGLLYGYPVAAARLAGSTEDADERKALLSKVDDYLALLRPYGTPPSGKFACHLHVVEAERHRAHGEPEAAASAYLRAIDSAGAGGFTLVQGWATELLGRLHLEQGREFGTGYLAEARDLFLRCGARGKADLLEGEFPQLMQSQVDRTSGVTSTSTSTAHGGPSLDLATVVKAAQAISSQTAYDQVVERLVAISVENAGAERGCFVPAGGDDLGYPDIEGYPGEDAPASVVAYVARTREAIVIADVVKDDAFARDPYVITRQPRSVAAGPIVRQGRLLGVLYLENTLLAGVFTPDRLELLRLLAAQMAISLENARLYTRLEEEVADRTRDLAASLADLRGAQARMVETEKLAALGGLVAGVAHEVNTPIGVAVTAASHLADRTREFERLYAAGPLRRSDLTRFTDTVAESQRIVSANLQRATDLVTSFKRVAVDQSSEARRTFLLAPYLDDVIASLQPALKRTPHGVEVACDPVLALDSYPGALAQVVTNLVLNSLTHAYADGEAGTLRLTVGTDGDVVRLDFTDEGRGVDPEVLPRVFEPFVTTRRSEGGSGLGLHLVHTLVTQRLGGTVRLDSEPGHGTRVTINVPSTAPEPPARTRTDAP